MADVSITDYLFVHRSESNDAKRMKKKLQRKKLLNLFTCVEVRTFGDNSVKALYNHLVGVKRQYSTHTNIHKITRMAPPIAVGFISDDVHFAYDLTRIPPPPSRWDVVCLEADIRAYDYNHGDNNERWCRVRVQDTQHFAVNYNSIDKVVALLKASTNWADFMKLLDSTNVFGFCNGCLSENRGRYVPFDAEVYNRKSTTSDVRATIVKQYTKSCYSMLRKLHRPVVPLNPSVATYDTRANAGDLPGLSLLTLLSDKGKFFHVLNTFLRLDYPREKLELVIVDDNNVSRTLKGILPEDKRIKIIDISPKNKARLPLGYKLNVGVKYASHELIVHFFETNIYPHKRMKDVAKAFVVSNKDMMTSKDSLMRLNGVSFIEDVPDLGNCVYRKQFWRVCPFPSEDDHPSSTLYRFLYNRSNCVAYTLALHTSFKIEDPLKDVRSCETSCEALPFDLRDLIHEDVVESFDMTILL